MPESCLIFRRWNTIDDETTAATSDTGVPGGGGLYPEKGYSGPRKAWELGCLECEERINFKLGSLGILFKEFEAHTI